jgi:hypothetical protein
LIVSPDSNPNPGVAAGEYYDVALLEHFWVAPYVHLLRHHARRLVLDLHNVESELMGQLFQSAARRMETKLLPQFDTVLVTSSEDAARIPVKISDLSNCIPDTPMPVRQEQFAIGMSANFEFFPNLLGVRWFARRVWPTLRQGFPGLEWRLIGKNPEAVSRWTSGDPQIVTSGPIPDAIAEIARCRAAVVPIRYGSGTRLKILEAWAAGTPVISTSKGCEGLNAETGEALVVADTPSAFTDGISQVLTDTSIAERLRSGEGLACARTSCGLRLHDDWMIAVFYNEKARMRIGVDAHAVGRKLTGNETYIRNLLREYVRAGRCSDLICYLTSSPELTPAVTGYSIWAWILDLCRPIPLFAWVSTCRGTLDETTWICSMFSTPHRWFVRFRL